LVVLRGFLLAGIVHDSFRDRPVTDTHANGGARINLGEQSSWPAGQNLANVGQKGFENIVYAAFWIATRGAELLILGVLAPGP
jgi:hypothetical protein